MREFILGNDHISKIIRECVDKYINEELGIANDVLVKTNEVRMKAKNDFLKVNEGIILEFKFNGMDEEIVNRRVDNYYKKLKGSK